VEDIFLSPFSSTAVFAWLEQEFRYAPCTFLFAIFHFNFLIEVKQKNDKSVDQRSHCSRQSARSFMIQCTMWSALSRKGRGLGCLDIAPIQELDVPLTKIR
jgi:hypothetical protein